MTSLRPPGDPNGALYGAQSPPATRSARALRRRRAELGWKTAAAGLILLNLLVVTDLASGLRAAVGLPVVAVLPGALLLRLLPGLTRAGWDWLLHAVALSMLVLLAGSFGLSLLPGRTLTTAGCLLTLDLLVAALALAVWRRVRRPDDDRPVPAPRRPLPELLLPAAPAGPPAPPVPDEPRHRSAAVAAVLTVLLGSAAVALVVAGADRLNGGGTAVLTHAGLGCAAAALAAAALAARAPRARTAAATGLYLLGLAVLLATSLRGDAVTGHDIKIEYRALTDTLGRSGWELSGLNLSYNSCLSITVLPAFLTRLLGMDALDVFRVGFQVLFAVVPVGVYVIARRLLPAGYAILAGGLFVAFPTFVNDLPMLNRQEIALLFFTVAVLTLLGPRSRERTVLFLLLATGLTVSHYTTSYTAAAMVASAWLTVRLLPFARAHLRRLALGMPALVLLLLSFGWALVTGNAGEVGGAVQKAAVAVVNQANLRADSSDYSLIGGGGQGTDEQALDMHLTDVRGRNAPYGGSTVQPPGCDVRLSPADQLTPTAVGEAVPGGPERANWLLRAGAVVLFQLGALLGTAVLWWRVRRIGPAGVTVASLCAGCLALLAASVVAPQLSGSYGLLRLFQQALVVLGPAVIVALVTVVGWASRRSERVTGAVTGAVVVGCLLSTSGFVPQLTGGYPPQLNLNNAGGYYHAYLATDADVRTARWIERNVRLDDVVSADSRDAGNLRSLTQKETREGMVPGAVPRGDYVVLTSTDGRTVTATAVAGDRVLRYSFPLDCVAGGRPLLYTDGEHRVYGQVRAAP